MTRDPRITGVASAERGNPSACSRPPRPTDRQRRHTLSEYEDRRSFEETYYTQATYVPTIREAADDSRSIAALTAEIYRTAAPESIIAIGGTSMGKDGVVHPRARVPLPASRIDLLPTALITSNDSPVYLSFTTLRPEAVRKPQEAKSDWTGEPQFFYAREDFAMSVCGLVIDLDVGRPNDSDPIRRRPAEEVVEQMRRWVEFDLLPEPSLIAFSGRGAYVIFLLEEADGTAPVAAGQVKTVLKRLSRDLTRQCADLGADASCGGPLVHWFKAPGSPARDSWGNLTRVRFEPFARHLGGMRRYSVAELMTTLGMPSPDGASNVHPVPRPREARPTGDSSRRVHAAAPRDRRAREIEALSAYRGGLQVGCRKLALFFYSQDVYFATAIRTGSEPKAWRNTEERVRALNRTFKPPLTNPEVRAAMTWRKSGRRRASNEVVTGILDVARHEVLGIEAQGFHMRCLVPHDLRREREQKEKQRRHAAQERRDVVDRLIGHGLTNSEIVLDSGVLALPLPVTRQFAAARRRRLAGLHRVHDVGLAGESKESDEATQVIYREQKAETLSGASFSGGVLLSSNSTTQEPNPL